MCLHLLRRMKRPQGYSAWPGLDPRWPLPADCHPFKPVRDKGKQGIRPLDTSQPVTCQIEGGGGGSRDSSTNPDLRSTDHFRPGIPGASTGALVGGWIALGQVVVVGVGIVLIRRTRARTDVG